MIRPKDRNPARTNYDPGTVAKSDLSTTFEGDPESDQNLPSEMDERESRKMKTILNNSY